MNCEQRRSYCGDAGSDTETVLNRKVPITLAFMMEILFVFHSVRVAI